MNATDVAPDERREARWGEGSPVVGGSEPDVEHPERGHPLPAHRLQVAGGLDDASSSGRQHGAPDSRADSGGRLTHASFFSGVGGLDLGLEAAGWRTVSFSEIDAYACAVLAEHWPDVPNLCSITDVGDVPQATLWSGGFPCTDLSIAGKRAGLTNDDGSHTRSGLAFAFLDLVERHRPEAILLENVYGLFSSHSGRDLGRLIRQMDELGFVGAWRGTDAQWFGVPQRRKRVFILAFDAQRHPDPDGPGTVLAVGTRCRRDHPQEREAWASSSRGTAPGAGEPGFGRVDCAPADPRGMRAPDGLAGWLDHRPLVASTLNSGGNQGGFRTEPGERIVTGPFDTADDDLLPIGLDSHRYRCAGNGVVAPVAYWIGTRLRRYFETCA